MNIVTSNPKVLKEPKPLVAVLELADSSVNLAVRPWCNSEDYWKVYSDITENVKLALDTGGIDSISTQNGCYEKINTKKIKFILTF